MTQLTNDELLTVLHTALEMFREEVSSDILASKIAVLTTAARSPGVIQKDVSLHVKGLKSSSVSRYALEWSDELLGQRHGQKFIDRIPDPQYRRQNTLHVSVQGQKWLNKLTDTVNSALAPKKRGGAH